MTRKIISFILHRPRSERLNGASDSADPFIVQGYGGGSTNYTCQVYISKSVVYLGTVRANTNIGMLTGNQMNKYNTYVDQCLVHIQNIEPNGTVIGFFCNSSGNFRITNTYVVLPTNGTSAYIYLVAYETNSADSGLATNIGSTIENCYFVANNSSSSYNATLLTVFTGADRMTINGCAFQDNTPIPGSYTGTNNRFDYTYRDCLYSRQ